MFQFFVENGQVRSGHAFITGQDVNHIRKVLRLKEGDRIRIVQKEDPDLYICRIAGTGEEEIDCIVEEKLQNDAELPCRIYLFQGLPKSDKMEWILQKAVELGVSTVIPVKTEHTVVKLDAKKAEGKTQRWQAIAEAAAKQSKRSIVPTVQHVMTFREALAALSALDVRLMAYEHADGMERTREILSSVRPGESVGILIGPEGGFSEEEVQAAKQEGIEAITLGGRILRTETAGLTFLSWLVYLLEK